MFLCIKKGQIQSLSFDTDGCINTNACANTVSHLSESKTKEIKDHPRYADLIEHLLVYPGKVADEIVEKTNRSGCEAIVLGSHSVGFLTRFFSGGTAKKVLKQTKKPVFMVSLKIGKINVTIYNE
jgi:hypothetical protein